MSQDVPVGSGFSVGGWAPRWSASPAEIVSLERCVPTFMLTFVFSRDRSPFTGRSEASFGPNLEPADLGKPGTTIAERPNAPKKPRAGQATSFNLVAWTLHLVGLCSCRQERRSPFIKLRVETEPVEPVKLILFKASLEKMCSRCCCLDCLIVYTRRRCIASTTKHHLKSR